MIRRILARSLELLHRCANAFKAMNKKLHVEVIQSVFVTFSTFDASVSWAAVTHEFPKEIDAFSSIEAWKTRAFIDV